MDASNKAVRFGLKKAFDYIGKDPDTNFTKLMDWVDRFAGEGPDSYEPQRRAFRQVIEDPENNMYQLLKSLWTDIDEEVLKATFENFILNANLIGWPQQDVCADATTAIFRGRSCLIRPRRVICTAPAAGQRSMATG